MKNKIVLTLAAAIFLMMAIFIFVEIRSFSVKSSSVFKTSDQTEIQMYVLINTFLDVDENKLAEEIVCEHQKINGTWKNTVYILKLYRTLFHYRSNREYDTIICDDNGAIICCGEDLGV